MFNEIKDFHSALVKGATYGQHFYINGVCGFRSISVVWNENPNRECKAAWFWLNLAKTSLKWAENARIKINEYKGRKTDDYDDDFEFHWWVLNCIKNVKLAWQGRPTFPEWKHVTDALEFMPETVPSQRVKGLDDFIVRITAFIEMQEKVYDDAVKVETAYRQKFFDDCQTQIDKVLPLLYPSSERPVNRFG